MNQSLATPVDTKMYAEASESAERVRAQLSDMDGAVRDVAKRLSSDHTRGVITCARGSSSHATVYAKYLLEPQLKKPVSSFSPSIASIYEANLDLSGYVFLAVSQSGGSEDLVRSAERARAGGAFTVALTNAPSSPLSNVSEITLPLLAGPELSVAATKSFICSLTLLAALSFAASDDEQGKRALHALPDVLDAAWASDWSAALANLRNAASLFVTARGSGFGIAKEAALKLKETSGLHAEALSAAELRHGPMAVVSEGFPILAFHSSDQTGASVDELVSYCASVGARCFSVGKAIPGAQHLDCPSAPDPRLTPIVQIQSFYRFANELSLARGMDPDEPPHLKKVTVTV